MHLASPLLRAFVESLRGGWRLFTLRPARPSQFALSPELFALLVIIDLVTLFAVALAVVGFDGEVNQYELPRTLMFVPMVLALGLLGKRVDRGSELLRLPVALAAVGLLFTILTSGMYFLAQRQWLPFAEAYWAYFDDVALGWSAIVVVIAVVTLTSGKLWARGALALIGVVLLVSPSVWMPVGLLWMPRADERAAYATGSFHTLAAESSFYAQQGALERELEKVQPQRPGIADLYFVGAALYAGEDVFMKELTMISKLLRERFDTEGRTVMLVNNPKTLNEYPIASLTSLREALAHVGGVMNPDEDVLVLYISSHGSDKHELVVDFRPMRFSPITPENLKSALAGSGIRWKVIVISACYSGGFIDSLKDSKTLIITAASADRTSFGCGSGSDATYLAQALFGDAMKETFSFEQGFGRARTLIEQWEHEQNQKPSQPQLYVGADIRKKLAEVEARLSAQPKHGRSH
jgi:hypothetical protein